LEETSKAQKQEKAPKKENKNNSTEKFKKAIAKQNLAEEKEAENNLTVEPIAEPVKEEINVEDQKPQERKLILKRSASNESSSSKTVVDTDAQNILIVPDNDIKTEFQESEPDYNTGESEPKIEKRIKIKERRFV
jgi:hypothetical protein